MSKFLSCFLAVTFLSSSKAQDCLYHKYCVIGAGPGGLQMGYFLHAAGRDYVVLEATNTTGSFFEKYPRNRKLISINKRHTGKLNVEFNLRHDWNSLLSHRENLLVTRYSKELFPSADVLLDYLRDFQRELNVQVKFNTSIHNIYKRADGANPDGDIFVMSDQHGQCYSCRILILATGLSTPNIPDMPGINLTKGYETVSIDPSDYEGKSVLILGHGNSAFETAAGIYGATNHVHMLSRSRVRLAWATHYVGDLRAVNNALLDTYQLKSLDGLLETYLSEMNLQQKGDKLYLQFKDSSSVTTSDNFLFGQAYDVVIRALGFTFDNTLLRNKTVTRGSGRVGKYPTIHANYESLDLEGLFYAGTLGHSLDFRKSAGGFIHGFRYTGRALHRLLEWRYEGVPWPSVNVPRSQLLNTLLKRMNEASGIYQMFQNLADVAVLSEDGQTVTYVEEFPINLLHQFCESSGINASSVLVLVMEYGKSFSGPASDVFRSGRAATQWSNAHLSNFLHPVIYYYRNLPTEKTMRDLEQGALPRPTMIHHILEDFLTSWQEPHRHILPLRRFLEEILQEDHRAFFSQICFQLAMTHRAVPAYCAQQYLADRGLYGTKKMATQSARHADQI